MSFIVRIFCEHSLFSLIFWLVPGMNVVVVLSLSANLTLPASAQLLSALALVHGGQLGAGVSKIGISFSRVLRGWFWTRTLTRSGHLDGSQVRPLLGDGILKVQSPTHILYCWDFWHLHCSLIWLNFTESVRNSFLVWGCCCIAHAKEYLWWWKSWWSTGSAIELRKSFDPLFFVDTTSGRVKTTMNELLHCFYSILCNSLDWG